MTSFQLCRPETLESHLHFPFSHTSHPTWVPIAFIFKVYPESSHFSHFHHYHHLLLELLWQPSLWSPGFSSCALQSIVCTVAHPTNSCSLDYPSDQSMGPLAVQSVSKEQTWGRVIQAQEIGLQEEFLFSFSFFLNIFIGG